MRWFLWLAALGLVGLSCGSDATETDAKGTRGGCRDPEADTTVAANEAFAFAFGQPATDDLEIDLRSVEVQSDGREVSIAFETGHATQGPTGFSEPAEAVALNVFVYDASGLPLFRVAVSTVTEGVGDLDWHVDWLPIDKNGMSDTSTDPGDPLSPRETTVLRIAEVVVQDDTVKATWAPDDGPPFPDDFLWGAQATHIVKSPTYDAFLEEQGPDAEARWYDFCPRTSGDETGHRWTKRELEVSPIQSTLTFPNPLRVRSDQVHPRNATSRSRPSRCHHERRTHLLVLRPRRLVRSRESGALISEG